MDRKAILLVGNVVSGVRVVGPFDDMEEAIAFGNDHIKNEDWTATDVFTPEQERGL